MRSPTSFHGAVLGAMWLVLECEQDWLSSRPKSWWRGWCWYIFRELVPDLVGEPIEPKQELAGLLNEENPNAVCQEILALASGKDNGHESLLRSLLRLLLNEPNAELDGSLCNMIRDGTIVERETGTVGEFVLKRAPELSVPVCLDILNGSVDGICEAGVEQVAVSLLSVRAGESWNELKTFLCSAEERGRKVLKMFAHEGESSFVESTSTRQLGELTGILIELFPPDSDPDLEGAHQVTPDESARTLRDRLISYLGRLEDAEAVAALRELERRFGARHSWLRRPRSEAERALRLSRWAPFPVDVVSSVLGAETRRLVRSEDDVVGGIEYALETYRGRVEGRCGETASRTCGIRPKVKPRHRKPRSSCRASCAPRSGRIFGTTRSRQIAKWRSTDAALHLMPVVNRDPRWTSWPRSSLAVRFRAMGSACRSRSSCRPTMRRRRGSGSSLSTGTFPSLAPVMGSTSSCGWVFLGLKNFRRTIARSGNP